MRIQFEAAIDTYNRYVNEFAVPAVAATQKCLATSLGSVSDPSCREWIAWTQQKDSYMADAIAALAKPIGEEHADRYRVALLLTVQGYRQAFSDAAAAIAAQDEGRWYLAMAAFAATQEQGRRADQIRFELLSGR